jgi:hypothetical protein
MALELRAGLVRDRHFLRHPNPDHSRGLTGMAQAADRQ